MTKSIQMWIGIGLALGTIYVVLSAGFFYAMCQPPNRFGAIMKHVPMPLMAVLPFVPMWNVARGGHLQPGDAAPDFALSTHDKSQTVRLSDFRGEKPVVLIFGSYT